MKPFGKRYFLVFLLAFALGGCAIFASGEKTFSENENRYLKTFSKIASTDDVEGVLADQFPLRDGFLTLSSGLKYAVGMRRINDTYIGRDGYLLAAVNETSFDEENFEKNLGYIVKFADNYDVDADVVIVPPPGLIMKKNLPNFTKGYNFNEKYDIINSALQSDHIHVIDLRAVLSELNTERQTYYRTDHHWTSTSAQAAYKVLMGLDPLDEETDQKLVTVTDRFRGTMYSRVLLPFSAYDEIQAMETDAETAAQLYDESKLSGKDKYAYFLGGNESRVDIYAEPAADQGSILLIKDSFANSLIPFLTLSYGHICAVDLRYFNDDMAALMEEGFDRVVVLYELTNFSDDTFLYKIARRSQ